jgi:serine/threonine-protein kinase RsbW
VSSELTIAGELSEVDRVRRFLRDVLQERILSEEDFFKVELAVVEACVNIILYAYPGKDGNLRIRVSGNEDRVVIEIRDSGIPFDPREVPEPEIDQMVETGKTGGLGIYLSRKLMDGFDYRREGDENVLTLTKTMRQSGVLPKS